MKIRNNSPRSEYNQASGKTRRCMNRLKDMCKRSDCNQVGSEKRCDKSCIVFKESMHKFGYDVTNEEWN